ncbi:MAG: TIGR01777 family oxidoreductase, partial [Acidobacteriota bacterium]|nr:TIGR01777 family oxidoreductase [Acidobacteriota bacterium]
ERGLGQPGSGGAADGEAGAGADPETARWEPAAGPPPLDALSGRDAVIHLAGETIAQRWSAGARERIAGSRIEGTRNLVRGLAMLAREERPLVLVCASAIGYYGARDAEPLDEGAPPGEGFLARVCVEWEREAAEAEAAGVRAVQLRMGVVLDASAGALAEMLGPFRHGLGGPVGGGRQYVSWVHPDDVAGLALHAIARRDLSGPINATAPRPVTNAELAAALAAALGRRAVLPIPALALRLRFGAMASLVTTGARVMPAKALVSGYRFRHGELHEALGSVLSPIL